MTHQIETQKRMSELIKRFVIAYLLLGLALATLSTVFNGAIQESAARQVTSFLKRSAFRGEYREIIQALNDGSLESFRGIVYFNKESKIIMSVPVNLTENLIRGKSFTDALIYRRFELPIATQDGITFGRVLFIYNAFDLVPISLAVWFIMILMTVPLGLQQKRKVLGQVLRELDVQKNEVIAEIAKKVRHDIRSPIQALRNTVEEVKSSSLQRNVNLAIDRISKIVDDLNDFVPTPKRVVEVGLVQAHLGSKFIPDLIDQIVNEKRALVKHDGIEVSVKVDESAFFFYSLIEENQFLSMISNILDNSIHAVSPQSGRIQISISTDRVFGKIRISDNGCGIETIDLPHVFEKHFTKGKANGSGLGLFYARETMLENAGEIEIASEKNVGTTIEIKLPLGLMPDWYTSEVRIERGQELVVIEDQISNIICWEEFVFPRLREAGVKIRIFSNFSDFVTWFGSQHEPVGKYRFIVDYHLGEKETGLDLIERFQIQDKAYLVTSAYDTKEVQQRCLGLNCKLVPKFSLGALIPVSLT